MGQILENPILEKDEFEGSNAIFQFGGSSMQGYRTKMEDQHCATAIQKFPEDFKLSTNYFSFFGVFDGHSGYRSAEFCSSDLLQQLFNDEEKRIKSLPNTPKRIFEKDKAIIESFLKTDFNLKKNVKEQSPGSGTTCISTILFPISSDEIEIICCNVGDSRCVYYDGEQAIPMSFDHKPDNSLELERIKECGGYVENGRVLGNLALSRAFGDFMYKANKNNPDSGPLKKMVVAVPEIRRLDVKIRKNKYQFLLLACDGVWDVMKNTEACEFILKRLEEQENFEDYENFRNQNIRSLYKLNENLKFDRSKIQKGKYDLKSICGDLLDHCVLKLDSKDNMSALIVLISSPNRNMMDLGKS